MCIRALRHQAATVPKAASHGKQEFKEKEIEMQQPEYKPPIPSPIEPTSYGAGPLVNTSG